MPTAAHREPSGLQAASLGLYICTYTICGISMGSITTTSESIARASASHPVLISSGSAVACLRACIEKNQAAPIHTPLPTPTTPAVQLGVSPRWKGLKCSGGPVRAKKTADVFQRGSSPPAPPDCNIAWRACRGDPCGRKIGCFFRPTISRWAQARPSQYYIMGVRGPLGSPNLVGCFFARTGISVLPLDFIMYFLWVLSQPMFQSAAEKPISVLAVCCHGASLVAG